MAVVEKEPDYDDIYGGEWLTGKSKNYFAVHRVCVADAFKRRGLTSVLYDFAARLALSSGRDSLRADTHRDNARRAELKAWCEKKGKSFEEEEGKYEAAQEAKRRRAEERAAAKAAKKKKG